MWVTHTHTHTHTRVARAHTIHSNTLILTISLLFSSLLQLPRQDLLKDEEQANKIGQSVARMLSETMQGQLDSSSKFSVMSLDVVSRAAICWLLGACCICCFAWWF